MKYAGAYPENVEKLIFTSIPLRSKQTPISLRVRALSKSCKKSKIFCKLMKKSLVTIDKLPKNLLTKIDKGKYSQNLYMIKKN